MKFLDYQADITWDEQADVFVATVPTTGDTIRFTGRSVGELREKFGTAIERHLEYQRVADTAKEPVTTASPESIATDSPGKLAEDSASASVQKSIRDQHRITIAAAALTGLLQRGDWIGIERRAVALANDILQLLERENP